MITDDHVRELLDGGADDGVLVLLGGRVEVVRAGELDSGRCRGALTVISRRDLLDRLGTGSAAPADADVKAVAAALDATVTLQGG